jgi:hypothetical protein
MEAMEPVRSFFRLVPYPITTTLSRVSVFSSRVMVSWVSPFNLTVFGFEAGVGEQQRGSGRGRNGEFAFGIRHGCRFSINADTDTGQRFFGGVLNYTGYRGLRMGR